MTKSLLLVLSLAIIIVTNTDAQVEKVAGFYSTNFDSYGFFGSRIKLNRDLSFKFYWSGDNLHYYGYGTYYLKKDTVFLNYVLNSNDSSTNLEEVITYHSSKAEPRLMLPETTFVKHTQLNPNISIRPYRLIYTRNRLRFIGKNGQIGLRYRARKRLKLFYYFGPVYWGYKEQYLQRRKESLWKDN